MPIRRAQFLRSSWWIVVMILSAGPAIVLIHPDSRLFVFLAAGVGGLLGSLLLRLLSTGLLTDPSWRRPRRPSTSAGRPPRREYVVPTEVPPPPGLLIGRGAEMERISAHLRQSPSDGPHVVVITGPAGVGKSALAIAAAQILTDRYRDGQLMARLDRAAGDRGIRDVLRMFVTALRDPGGVVPESSADLARRYQELIAGRRVLVILDAVATPAQIGELLPRGRGCGIIVTARGDWPADAGQLQISIDRLSSDAARDVLDALVGGGRVEAEHGAAQQIVDAADRHPFALQVAGVALAARREWTLAIAVERMNEARLAREHRDGLPRYAAVFDLSYALLTEQERDALALLGLMGDHTFAPWALGALRDDDDATAAERIIDRLVNARLVERLVNEVTGFPVFRVYEEVRPYVLARLADIGTERRRAALARLATARVEHGERSPSELLRTSVFQKLNRGELKAALDTAWDILALCDEQQYRVSTDEGRRRAWAERALALAALAEVNVELGWMDEARQYAAEALEIGEGPGRARAQRCLGMVYGRLRRLDDAERCLRDAMRIAEVTSDRQEIIRALRDLTMVLAVAGRTEPALEAVRRALDLCRQSGDRGRRRLPAVYLAYGAVLLARTDLEQANTVLVQADQLAGDPVLEQALWRPWIRHQRALVALAQQDHARAREFAWLASSDFRDMHHRYGIARCRLVLGRAYLGEGNAEVATPALREAHETFTGCGDRWGVADSRTWLAQAHLRAGRLREAEAALVQAEQDFEELNDAAGRARVRYLLAEVDSRHREVSRWRREAARVVVRPLAGVPSQG